jgi:hypothetical protein
VLRCKTFEVLDAGTFIPCFGVLCEPVFDGPGDASAAGRADSYLLFRAGYQPPREGKVGRCVIFTRLDGHPSNIAPYDPIAWGRNRTMSAAHEYVRDHWDELPSGAVVDVEHIKGERVEPKRSEGALRFAAE